MSGRYAVEQDSPDGGRSTYVECWGRGGIRGRVLSEHDTLAAAIVAAGAVSDSGCVDGSTWIWDRLRGRRVHERDIAAAGGRVTPGFRRMFAAASSLRREEAQS